MKRAPGSLAHLPVDQIDPNPRQPRTNWDLDALEELAASVGQLGVLQPVVVRPNGARFELVMGERRLRAARMAGLTDIPALVRDVADEALLREAVVENVLRADLNPLEEAAAYQGMVDDLGLTQDAVAELVGRSRSHVGNTMRLLRLTAPVQRRVAAGVLSAGHARALVTVPDPSVQEALAARIVAEGLSVRQVEELILLGDLPGWEGARPQRPAGPGSSRRAWPMPELSAALGEKFDTRVKVISGAHKGSITIEFAGMEDLARLVMLLAPDVGPDGLA